MIHKSLKRLLSLNEIQKDRAVLEKLTKESIDELKNKLKEAEKDLPFKIITVYRHLASVETDGFHWEDLGIPTIGSNIAISERIRQYLIDKDKILTRITPKYILDKTFSEEEK